MNIIKSILTNIIGKSFFAIPILKFVRSALNSKFIPSWLKKVLMKIRSYLPRKRITKNIRLSPNLEITLKLDLNNWGEREFFYSNYETGIISFYQKLLSSKSCVWDIGTYVGFYTIIAGKLLKKRGRVFSFEPLPQNFEVLKENIRLNDLENVTVYNFALSSSDEETVIYTNDSNEATSMASLDEARAISINFHNSIKIRKISALNFLKNGHVMKPDLIKIDTEAHEPVILNDLKPILMNNNAPDIFCEVLSSTREAISRILIEECGYTCYRFSSNSLVEVKSLSAHESDKEYFFTKNSPKLFAIP